YTHSHVDDIALLAKNENEMKGLIRTLERYIERKKLEVNEGKTIVMRCGKGGGRRRKDWARSVWLFDKLVWSVLCYGVEIWGWKAREEVERIQDRFLRWVLGVSRSVAGYMVREELQRDRLEGKAGIRAWSFEKKVEEGGGAEIVWRCRLEMKKRVK
ncbi:GSCOCG00011370001-RA-CDS, partial [Cotesia congregata]